MADSFQPPTVMPPPPVIPLDPASLQAAGQRMLENGRRGFFGTTFKLFSVGFLVLLLLIPVFMINSLLTERQSRRDGAVKEITSMWGDAQEVVGPVLMVPYRAPVKVVRQERVNGRMESVEVEEMKTVTAFFLPERLEADGSLLPELRRRGIYEAVLYRGSLTLSGVFRRPSLDEWKVKPEQILWDDAVVVFAVSDLRGVDGSLSVNWDGKNLPFTPGCKLPGFKSGLTASLRNAGLAQGQQGTIPFNLKFGFNGSREIRLAPLGAQTEAKLATPWADPKFIGTVAPDSREIGTDRFTAKWKVSGFSRSYPQQWSGAGDGCVSGEDIRSSMFGVALLNLVDVYREVERVLKYAILFIVLVFSTFFLFEVTGRLRIHPVQYILVGAALCLFYLGLLALSEVVSFGKAYLIGAAAATSLIGFYSTGVLKSGTRGGLLTGGLALVYGFLYVVLQLQDFSLLMGTAGLFILLAAIMAATRKTDWYARDAAQAPPAAKLNP